jgi:predicted nucleotidyltransferase
MTTENILSEITTTLKQFGIEKIILFGSFAYGTPNMDSDIDLLVIKDIPENEIPMRMFSHQPKMNIWGFHATIKKQIIYA